MKTGTAYRPRRRRQMVTCSSCGVPFARAQTDSPLCDGCRHLEERRRASRRRGQAPCAHVISGATGGWTCCRRPVGALLCVVHPADVAPGYRVCGSCLSAWDRLADQNVRPAPR